MYLFWLNLTIIFILIVCFCITRKTNIKWEKVNDYFGIITNTVNSVRYGNLSTKIEPVTHLKNRSYDNLTDSINRMVETLKDREKMISEYQSELMRQNMLLETVINSLTDGILIINDKNQILKATPKINEWFGHKQGELSGKNIMDFIEISEGSNLHDAKNLPVFIKHNPNKNYCLSAIELHIDEKKRFVILITDITNEKQLESLKEDFIATLTHDLKVPIVAEGNMLNFFLEEKFGTINDKQKFALEGMKKSNSELIELVQIILDTYKVKETGIKLIKENVEVNKFLSETVKEMTPIATQSGLKIKLKKGNNCCIFADKFQLTRVMKNLISNAIIHGNTGKSIEISVAETEGFINIYVVDFGQGIPKDEIPLIFNKYYSANKKYRKIGTGLGLYLAQQIVNAHGGEINVSSTENVRTEFCVKLPVV